MLVASGGVELGSDENAFVIRAIEGDLLTDPWQESTLVDVPSQASGSSDVLILTANQWGPFTVTTQVHDTAPEVDQSWEDVVEFSLRSTGPMVVAELVNHDPSTLLVETPGEYRVRVSATGRRPGDPDDHLSSAKPASRETYLVQAWPAPTAFPAVLRETSEWARAIRDEGPSPDDVPERPAGLAAAQRIGRDANGDPGARPLSGSCTTLEFELEVRGTPRRVSERLKFCPDLSHHVPSWSMGSVGLKWDEPAGDPLFHSSFVDHPDQLPGTGCIRTRLLEDQRVRGWTSGWTWMVPSAGGSRFLDDLVPLFEETTVSTSYEQVRDVEGQPWTKMRLSHSNVPVEWAEDLRAWWRYQLAVLRSAADREP